MKSTTLAMAMLIAQAACFGQIDPESAHVSLYFPQLADGGTQAQRWQTSFIFVNPHLTLTASLRLWLFGDDGRPLILNLGSGPSSIHDVSIPPGGTRTLRSTSASPSVVTGWAYAGSTLPVQATVLYRAIENGVPRVEVSAPATLPSGGYVSPATRDLGVALGNVYDVPRSFNVAAYNGAGTEISRSIVSLGPLGHTSFNLAQRLPNLPSNFEGSIRIFPTVDTDQFVAWTLNVDRGLISTLPSGRFAWPISHWDRIWLVYAKVLAAAPDVLSAVGGTLPPITLNVSDDPVINAFARAPGTIQINLALSELISDSPGELAFVVAHEIAHVAQFRRGTTFLLPNREQDADVLGMLMLLFAGYDPYAGAGALAKLSMASQKAGLLAQFFDDLADPHGSFGTRIEIMFSVLSLACSQPGAAEACALYRGIIHPHFPPTVPLYPPDPDTRRVSTLPIPGQ
jgi:hypothetical protein